MTFLNIHRYVDDEWKHETSLYYNVWKKFWNFFHYLGVPLQSYISDPRPIGLMCVQYSMWTTWFNQILNRVLKIKHIKETRPKMNKSVRVQSTYCEQRLYYPKKLEFPSKYNLYFIAINNILCNKRLLGLLNTGSKEFLILS